MPLDEWDLHLWAWKKRNSFLGINTGWELRSIVIRGTKLCYYVVGQEEDDNPRGMLDLFDNNVEAQVVAMQSDAPTPYQVNLSATKTDAAAAAANKKSTRGSQDSSSTSGSGGGGGSPIEWRLCFEQQEDLMRFLDVVHGVLEKGGAYVEKDPDRFEHDFHAADHIYRWEMLVCPPVIYPIQIHGIVLDAGRNCVVVADFGLTGYGRKEGSDFNHNDDHASENAISAAWKKLRPTDQDQRLHIVTLTDPYEIRKWTRAKYDEESLFSTKHNKTLQNFTKNMKSAWSLKPSRSQDDAEIGGKYQTTATKEEGEVELPQSDPKEIVLARANFLFENMDALPPYHVFYSNSECIAVWCKTGRWSTLQTAVFLSSNSVGAAKSSILATVGVAAANPFLAPVVAVGGLVWVSAPMVILQKSRVKWEETTKRMTELFWSNAPPAVFVSAIENWSGIGSVGSSRACDTITELLESSNNEEHQQVDVKQTRRRLYTD